MNLTGPVFLDGIVAVTVLAFIALVWVWPRLGGGTPWQVVGRVAGLGLVNVLVLLVAATQLNAQYLFFAGWGDLAGAISGHIAQTKLDRGGDASKAAEIAVRGAAAHPTGHLSSPGRSVPVGSTLSYQVHGTMSGLTGTGLVSLPPSYASAAQVHERYPVLEAFHGYPSEPSSWVKIFHIGQAVEQQVQAGKLAPSIVVMPQVEFPRGVDTEGVNGAPGQPQVETWLTRDVPDWLAQHFRVEAKRSAWATIGYSAGGFDAAMATILHPAQYGAGIVLGGYFRPEFGPFYQPFSPRSPMGQRYDLPRVVDRFHTPVSLWVETSHADAVSYTSSARFLRSTKAPTAVHAVVLQNAGHRDQVWIALLPEALQWLGQNISGFSPHP